MKKTLAALVALSLSVSLCSCGKDNSDTKKPSNKPSQTEQVAPAITEWEVKDGVMTVSGNARMYDYNVYEVENGSIRWKDEEFTKVNILDGVNHIGSFSFFDFDKIEAVSVPGSVDTIGSSAFAMCDGLKSVTLEEGIREIGLGAFGSCVNLSEINIPQSVTVIQKGAFYGCSSLESLTITSPTVSFGDADVFTGCTSLTIKCPEGSTAQAQAEKYGIPCEIIE